MKDFARRRDRHFSLQAWDIFTFKIARPTIQSVLSASARHSDSSVKFEPKI